MHEFTLPTNIKQIGGIENGLRIYMEDYVCTFLQQYAMSGGFEERIAYLVGKHMVIDSQSFLFISGAIYGKHAEKVEGYSRFTAKSAEYAEEMLDEYFPGMEIVGWMQSQPGYGTYLNQHYGAYHLRQFTKPYHVLFVSDPLEKINAFYLANPHAITPAERLEEAKGYFIYYEKNVNMHEYMLTNTAVEYAQPEAKTEAKVVAPIAEKFLGIEHYADEPKSPPFSSPRRTAASQAGRGGQKRQGSVIAAVCAVLFVVAFVMGISLIRSQDRLDQMENEIRQLIAAHRNLFTQVNSQELAPVFAETAQQPEPQVQQPQSQDIATALQEETPMVDLPALEPEVSLDPPLILERPELTPSPPPPIYSEDVGLFIPLTYEIQPGDSLSAISYRFFGTVERVAEILVLNDLDNPDHIVVGRVIALPQP